MDDESNDIARDTKDAVWNMLPRLSDANGSTEIAAD